MMVQEPLRNGRVQSASALKTPDLSQIVRQLPGQRAWSHALTLDGLEQKWNKETQAAGPELCCSQIAYPQVIHRLSSLTDLGQRAPALRPMVKAALNNQHADAFMVLYEPCGATDPFDPDLSGGIAMLGMLVTLVLATAGGIAVASIGTSLRRALPTIRRLNADRRALALDHGYLITLIDTPRHDGTRPPAPVLRPVPAPATASSPIRRRVRVSKAPLRAAA